MAVHIESYGYLKELVERLPQKPPFRFVDAITAVSEASIGGFYTFPLDAWFYRGHFPAMPVTPGVILLESMAQIGVVALWLHLNQSRCNLMDRKSPSLEALPLFTDANVEFLRPIYPGTKVTVDSQKKYFRRGKLCCDTKLFDADGQLAVSARISGKSSHDANS